MAKEIITRLLDDLDGSEAATSVEFTWNGVAYEIDLSKKNARDFESAIAPYVRAARRGGSKSAPSLRGPRPRGRGKRGGVVKDLSEVRAWAAANGHAVAERGRIPGAVVEAFNSAQGLIAEVKAEAIAPARPSAARTASPAKRAARKSAPRTAKSAPRTAKSAPRPAAEKAAAAKTPAVKAAAKKATTRSARAAKAAAPVASAAEVTASE
jgi:hypothetical protein